MKQKVTKARKAHVRCIAPYWSLVYNAPVWMRNKLGIFGADHASYCEKHGLVDMPSVNPVII